MQGPHKSKVPVEDLTRKVSQAFELLNEDETSSSWISALQPVEQTKAGAEQLAEKFRAIYFGDNQLSPLTNLPSIAVDNLGILVYLVDNPDFEGSSALLEGRAFMFLARRIIWSENVVYSRS